jgi:hypothetical protein
MAHLVEENTMKVIPCETGAENNQLPIVVTEPITACAHLRDASSDYDFSMGQATAKMPLVEAIERTLRGRRR